MNMTADCFAASKEETVEKYFNMISKLALIRTKDRHSADDVVQEVFMRFLKTDTKFETEEHIKAWLIKVTINCSKSLFLSAWAKKTVPLDEDIPFESPEKSDIYYAVHSLPQKYKAVIHLFYYEQMSVAEIAKYLDTKESTVKSQLHRGRELLKSLVKGDEA